MSTESLNFTIIQPFRHPEFTHRSDESTHIERQTAVRDLICGKWFVHSPSKCSQLCFSLWWVSFSLSKTGIQSHDVDDHAVFDWKRVMQHALSTGFLMPNPSYSYAYTSAYLHANKQRSRNAENVNNEWFLLRILQLAPKRVSTNLPKYYKNQIALIVKLKFSLNINCPSVLSFRSTSSVEWDRKSVV